MTGSNSQTDDELFRAGQVRAISRAFDEASAQAALEAIGFSLAHELPNRHAPEQWVAGILDIESLIREAFPAPQPPPR